MVRASQSVQVATLTVLMACSATQEDCAKLKRACKEAIQQQGMLSRTVKKRTHWSMGMAMAMVPHAVRVPVELVTTNTFFNTAQFVAFINHNGRRVYNVSIFLYSNGKIKVTGLPELFIGATIAEAVLVHVAAQMIGKDCCERFRIPREATGLPVHVDPVMTLGNFYLGGMIDMHRLRWFVDALNVSILPAKALGHHLFIRMDTSVAGGVSIRNHAVITCLVPEEELTSRTSRYQLKLFANGAVTIVGNSRYPRFGTQEGMREIEEIFRRHVAPHILSMPEVPIGAAGEDKLD